MQNSFYAYSALLSLFDQAFTTVMISQNTLSVSAVILLFTEGSYKFENQWLSHTAQRTDCLSEALSAVYV